MSKSSFSKNIHANHGASPKYIRKLLVPVGIDFNPDANTKNSIIKLAKSRGDYAHKGRVSRVMSPEDAEKIVADYLAFSETIRDKANQAVSDLT